MRILRLSMLHVDRELSKVASDRYCAESRRHSDSRCEKVLSIFAANPLKAPETPSVRRIRTSIESIFHRLTLSTNDPTQGLYCGVCPASHRLHWLGWGERAHRGQKEEGLVSAF